MALPSDYEAQADDSQESETPSALRELKHLVDRGNARVLALLAELEYRRQEMESARLATQKPFSKGLLSRTELGKRAAAWHPSDNGEEPAQ